MENPDEVMDGVLLAILPDIKLISKREYEELQVEFKEMLEAA